MSASVTAETERLRDEVVELTRRLIRIDTSNPPGGETPAAELLASHLRDAGLEPELVGPDPKRLSLVARVQGGNGPSLMLLGHTDVVPAPTANWTADPFSGELRDGHVIGRGAADMKGEVAARAVAIAELARGGVPPPGDVVFVAESDEERNVSDVGMSWLARNRPDLRCDFALNEGGGMLLELASGGRLITISVGEKQVSHVRLRFSGTAGHASVPARADNPLRAAAAAVQALLAAEAPPGEVPSVERALEALGAPRGDSDRREWAMRENRILGEMLPAMTRLTVTPTGLQTHEPANVIPPFADVICDVRALAGQCEDDVRAHVAKALGDDDGYELEFLEPMEGGTESPTDTALYSLCESYVAERVPGAALLPVVTPGFTDSHWIRRDLGTVAYGFAPVLSTDPDRYLAGIHSADEAIAADDLAEMAAFSLRAARWR